VVVDISMRFCGPCKAVYPLVAELSNQLPDVEFYHLCGDLDEATRSLARSWRITATPNFHFYRNGARVFSFMGAKPDLLLTHLSRLTKPEANATARQVYLDRLHGKHSNANDATAAPPQHPAMS
jgi:thiol-disulfide isomerase/thioredoxin